MLLLRKIGCLKDWKNAQNLNASKEDDCVSAVHLCGRTRDPGLCQPPNGANSKTPLNNAKDFISAQFGLREPTHHLQQDSTDLQC